MTTFDAADISDMLREFTDAFKELGKGSLAKFLTVFTPVVLSILLIGLLLGVCLYVFQSIGVYTTAKRRGLKAPGLAWVPIACAYTMGGIADQYDMLAKGRTMNLRWWMLWLAIGNAALSWLKLAAFVPAVLAKNAISPLAFIVSVAFTVFNALTLYRIYRSCKGKDYTALLVLSIIFPVVAPFALFALRGRDEGMAAPQPPPYQCSADGGEAPPMQ